MNKIVYFVLGISMCVFGCTRSTVAPIAHSVIGQWTYVAYYYSIGGPGSWRAVSQANQTIEFKADGSFVSTVPFLSGVNQYELVDRATIRFQPVAMPSGYMLMRYQVDSIARELYLDPVDPACIEGCGHKFSK